MARRFFHGATTEDILFYSSLEPIGPIAWQTVYENVDSLPELEKLSRKKLEELGLTSAQIGSIRERKDVSASLRLLKNRQVSVITLEDPRYPKLLREINDPPLWLFYLGEIELLDRQACLTIVGTRRPSAYALTALEQVIAQEVAKKVCLISGLAYGVDKAVHQLALKNRGKTVAVLAGGLDSIYPADHTRLSHEIVANGGCIISEYPPLSRPKPYRFPVRNRIIAGLSQATVVVQAKLKSGTLTTAKSALDYNRDVFSIPGDIVRDSSEGANFLIKHGATLLDDPKQLLDYFEIKPEKRGPKLDSVQAKLLNFLQSDSLSVDQLICLTRQPIEQLLGDLTKLELEGIIYQTQTGEYARKKR